MGIFVNPGNESFIEIINDDIYVDKTGLLRFTNSRMGKSDKYICVSRPRRFGKSVAAEMLTAYYSAGCQSEQLFSRLEIAQDSSFREHLNRYDVIRIDVQWVRMMTDSSAEMIDYIQENVIGELREIYPEIIRENDRMLSAVLAKINAAVKKQFVVVIDEWDSVIREEDSPEEKRKYLDFLRGLFKGTQPSAFLKLAYITGILPIIKYDTESALNNFKEYTMLEPEELACFVGFTEREVKALCEQYRQDFGEVRRWYDGYQFGDISVYNPKAIVSVLPRGRYKSYWSKTGTYESLLKYIRMNFDGLKDCIILMLGGERCKINPASFQNDLSRIESRDDVLTVLVHLGYLAYDEERREVYIPNEEIREEFVLATQRSGWSELVRLYEVSDNILEATWNQDAKLVAQEVERCHMENTSILNYNDENALSCVVCMAYLSAEKYYFKPVREFPAGKGYADLVYLPRKEYSDKPVLVIELKWDKCAEAALAQIEERRYIEGVPAYADIVLKVGISYDRKTKKHQCRIVQSSLQEGASGTE